jgi:hypothetical protein
MGLLISEITIDNLKPTIKKSASAAKKPIAKRQVKIEGDIF